MKGKAYLPFQSVVLVNAYPGFTFELPSLLFPGPRLLGYGAFPVPLSRGGLRWHKSTSSQEVCDLRHTKSIDILDSRYQIAYHDCEGRLAAILRH